MNLIIKKSLRDLFFCAPYLNSFKTALVDCFEAIDAAVTQQSLPWQRPWLISTVLVITSLMSCRAVEPRFVCTWALVSSEFHPLTKNCNYSLIISGETSLFFDMLRGLFYSGGTKEAGTSHQQERLFTLPGTIRTFVSLKRCTPPADSLVVHLTQC